MRYSRFICSSCISPTSALESIISLISSGSFRWRLVFKAKIWALTMHVLLGCHRLCLSIYVRLSVHPSMDLSNCLSVCLPTYLSRVQNLIYHICSYLINYTNKYIIWIIYILIIFMLTFYFLYYFSNTVYISYYFELVSGVQQNGET